MAQTTYTEGGPGRPSVKIEERDDRDRPYPLEQAGAFSVRGLRDFQVIYQATLVRARRGQITATAVVGIDGTFPGEWVAIEWNLLGYTHSGADVLYRGALDGHLPLQRFSWEEPQTFTAIGVEARQVVDGAPSGVITGITDLALSISGFYWR